MLLGVIVYANDNPTRYVDPTGHQSWTVTPPWEEREGFTAVFGEKEGNRRYEEIQAANQQFWKETADILTGMGGRAGELVKEGFVGTVVGIVHLLGAVHPDAGVRREAQGEIKEAASEASGELKDRLKTTARGITDVPAAFAELGPEAGEALLDLAATEKGRRQIGEIYTDAAAPVVAAGAAAESLPALARNARDFFQKARHFLDEAFETGPRIAPPGTAPKSGALPGTPAPRVTGQPLAKLRGEFESVTKPAYWKEYGRQIDDGVISNPFGRGEANLSRIRQGLPPIGPDGRPVPLHHIRPLSRGGTNEFENLVPFNQTTHQRFTKILHDEPFPGEQYQLQRR